MGTTGTKGTICSGRLCRQQRGTCRQGETRERHHQGHLRIDVCMQRTSTHTHTHTHTPAHTHACLHTGTPVHNEQEVALQVVEPQLACGRVCGVHHSLRVCLQQCVRRCIRCLLRAGMHAHMRMPACWALHPLSPAGGHACMHTCICLRGGRVPACAPARFWTKMLASTSCVCAHSACARTCACVAEAGGCEHRWAGCALHAPCIA